MTVLVTRQPNIGGLNDQTSISLDLFNTILEIANNCAELHDSWEFISRDLGVCE